jgi:hypothetical protein
MQNTYFEFCQFEVEPRRLLTAPGEVRTKFVQRARATGGQLYGFWRNLGGLGLRRDEGIAVTAWRSQEAARASAPVANSQPHVLQATVRPTSDAVPTYPGIYVFRWFDIHAKNWETFRDLSNEAWPNMESVFDANICGFWRSLDIQEPDAKVLLLTRYADLSVWEASRWWRKPSSDAGAAMSRFDYRNDLTESSIAFPVQPIFASGPG